MRHLAITVILLLAATLTFAGEEPRLGREVAEFLQLTPAQKTAWDNAHADFRTATTPLFTRIEQLGRDVEVALKSKTADACGVGSMLLAQQAVLDQVKAQKETLQQKIEAVLTPDQRTKYEAFKAAQPQVYERRKISRQ
ncbi:MAG TPA: Spy/CpxP family protein refolding chaperone [Thermoanaerobaculia bacterium]|nr:Spy/CpxP family protein refolding chaperone [Thermoanaerobaculia bacterium]